MKRIHIIKLVLLCAAACCAGEERWLSIFNLDLGSDVVEIIKDPARPFVYAIDRGNSEILFVDLDRLEVSKRIHVGEAPSSFDIDDSGNYLYVGNAGDGSGTAGTYQIAKVNLNAQEKVGSFDVPAISVHYSPLQAENITCGSGNVVYYNAGYKIWNSGLGRMMDGLTGDDLGALAKIKSPMVLSPDKKKLYGQYIYSGNLGEMGVWDLSVGPTWKMDSRRYSPYPYGWDYNNYSISGDGKRLAMGKVLFNAADLADQKGVFSELVYALDFDGGTAFGKSAVWDTTTFAESGDVEKISDLPFSSAIVDFDDAERRLYAFNSEDQTLHVVGDPYAIELSIFLAESVDESGGVVAGEVAVNAPLVSNLVVTLVSDDVSEAVVDAGVTILAGQTNAAFNLQAVDDGVLDGSQRAVITASASNYWDGVATLLVHDNETATLTLSLPQTTFEGAGTISGAVMVDPVPDEDVTVELVSNNPSKIAGRSIVLPAGQGMVSFTLDVVDDNLIDGMQTATISAEVQNWTGSQTSVFIFDNETTVLAVQLPDSAVEGDGVLTNAGTVSLSGVATSDIHVSLASSDISEAVVPASVMISNGQSSVSFDITIMDDADTDGMQSTSISAQTPGFVPGSDTITVQDNDLYALAIDGLATNQPVLEPVAVNITAMNIDGMPMTWFTGSVSLAATGDLGAVELSPTSTTNFIGGEWSGDVAFGNIANNVVLVADDGAGHSGTSTVFNVTGSHMVLTPASLTNTLVVAGGTFTRTMVISNAGNTELEFVIKGGGGGGEPVDPSLIAHFPFNGNADDETGNGHDGTVLGGLAYEDGINGLAAKFNGSNAKIQVLHDDALNFDGKFSIALWVKSDATNPYSGLVSKILNDVPRDGYLLYANSSYGDVGIMLNEDFSSSSGVVIATNDIINGAWHHVVSTYDEQELSLYIDGVLEVQLAYTNGLTPNSMPLYIGWDPYDNIPDNRYFNGMIDELRIYNRALSAAEISDLYNEDGDPGLIAHFPFNGNADDETGNGHDGTIIGATLTADRFGNTDSAYSFDGVNDYIDLGSMGGIKTVSMWIKQRQRSGAELYFGHEEFRVYASSLSGGDLVFSDGSSQKTITDTPMDSYVDQWVHVVALGDGVDSKLFLNGSNVTVSSGNVGPAGDSVVNLGRWITGQHYVNADLDDVRIYDRLLSESEISDLYNESDNDDDGLVAHFPFNGNADDESGNGHDGTVIGATPTTDRFGNPDSAYLFDGIDDRMQILNESAFDFDSTDEFSHSCWIRTDDTSLGNKTLISKMMTSSPNTGYEVFLREGKIFVYLINVHNQHLGEIYLEGNTLLSDGGWHHVVFAYTGTSSATGITLYIDGEVETFNAILDRVSGSILNDVALSIGARSDRFFFKGSMDDIRIYNRALSAAEILELYQAPDEPVEPGAAWLSVDPKTGTVPPGASLSVSVRFDAAGLAAGDYSNTVLVVTGNDALSPSNGVPASMWVVPPAPTMLPEPESTEGSANEVAWNEVAGPVTYWVETTTSTNLAPLQDSGWIAATNHVFGGLEIGVAYHYRVKASVASGIGLLEGAWSDWVWSEQVVDPTDSDGDGLPDWWELAYFGGATNGLASDDPDGDGQSNRDEYVSGMDPTNSASRFMVRTFDSPGSGLFVLGWDSVTGRVYSVYSKTNLPAAFQTLETGIHHPQNSYTDSVHSAESQGFYRIGVELE